MSEQKNIFIVWTNTDLTEGRGHQVPVAFCESRATAVRLSKRAGVQGTDADVQPFPAIKHQGSWCAPFRMTIATDADKKQEIALEERARIIEKAIASGMTKEELASLGVRA